MPDESHPQPPSPFASPNAIPPRTSSTGILNVNGAVKPRSSVLRPLSEIDWLGQSKKTKHTHSSTAHLRTSSENIMSTDAQSSSGSMTNANGVRGVGDDLIYGNDRTWTEEKERILLGPYDYLYGHPGKDIRSQLIAAFNKWLRVPPERLDVITRVVGMLHTASLLYGPVQLSSPI
jgi:geranylgeranyl diphosphate synthase type 3